MAEVTGYALRLGAGKASRVKSFQGGAAFADVINEAVGPDYFVKKHLGPTKYEEVSVQVSPAQAKPLLEWAQASWRGRQEAKTVTLVAPAAQGKAAAEREFANALLVETTFPTFDGASKEEGYLTFKLRPEQVTQKKPQIQTGLPAAGRKWLPSNYRLEIAGLDCSRVNKIEALTVKQPPPRASDGVALGGEKAVAKTDFPNLVITLPESTQSVLNFFEDFVIRGHRQQLKNGTLTLLGTDMKQELARLTFRNLGIFRLTPVEPSGEAIRRIKAEMYCEEMTVSVP